ncbi:uncharacterized protein LOC114264267 [Camellia sinensis]|uniref:uncharacterized protein LOC114264267 n=1 Tax=Camellia sinensis TaxID=4442 RepID=UPI0010355933|nr:uncharacterized protein LOC114264267 [Camellia sinensis]
MGVEKARSAVFGDYSSSFDDLRWYVDAANEVNPGSVFDMEFVIDSLYLLCFAIVDSESYHNWYWFLSKLLVILTARKDIAFVTDQHGGLQKALADVLPCAQAPTIELFNELFKEFKGRCGRSVQKFLEDLPNERWCNAYFQGKMYSEMCTNVTESFYSWIRNKLHLFSTNLADVVRVKLIEQFSNQREVGNKWNRIVCSFAEKKLEKAFNDSKAWIVKKYSDDIYEIQLGHSVMVDIRKRSCSCRLWEIDYFPCKHGFCAIKRSVKDLNCFLDDYYHVRSYCYSYLHSIYPAPNMWKPNVVVNDDVVLPPLCKRSVGHLRAERISSKGEIKRIRRSRCGKMGTHNRKTCKQALV